ncbi:MFS transporter [Streptomyces buecherae]|uniref:MFS transporter n=1 Tax=Streptomyces buecherae TaxID=2763006 RepID=UPI0037B9F373
MVADSLLPADTPAPAAPPDRPPMPWRLVGSLFGAYLALFICYSALTSVFLPNQVSDIDPDDKVANLAVVTTLSSVATLLVQPVVGALSDRTHSRLGRRAPWMLLGALLGAVFLAVLPLATSVGVLAVLWVLVQATLNIAQSPLTAVLPDRVPVERRGVASTFVGVATMVGTTVGAVIAAGFAHRAGLGHVTIAAFVLVVVALFVVLNPEPDSRGAARAAWSWRAFARGMWVSPRQHPDFAWAFGARVLLTLGFWILQAFQLYLLRDHVGMDDDTSNAFVAKLSVVMLVAVVVSAAVTGPWSDRVRRRKPFVAVCSLLMALAMTVPLVAPTESGMYVYAALLGLGFGGYQSLDLALMTEVLPSRDSVGKDLGLLNVATNLPQAIAPALGGLVINQMGGYPVLLGCAATVAALSALAVLPIRSVR